MSSGSGSRRMPNAFSTPSRTSRATERRSDVEASPLLVTASVCFVDRDALPPAAVWALPVVGEGVAGADACVGQHDVRTTRRRSPPP